MNNPFPRDNDKLQHQLQSLVTTVTAIAQEHQSDCNRLLLVLRTLEQLHREIRTGMFEPSLPNTRQALYGLLREIEETGGWPYIERMKLQNLMVKLRSGETEEVSYSTPDDNLPQ